MASFHYRVGRFFLAITLAVSLVGSFVRCANAVQLNAGDIVISDFLGGVYGLMRIDPVTGDRTIISDATHGSGPTFNFNGADSGGPPSGVSRIAGGDLLVSATNGLFSVDPVTGDRTLINTRPTADAIQVGNQIYAVDGSELYRVDPTTGDTTNLAALGSLADAVVYANGKLFTASAGSITSYSLAGVSLANYIPVAQLVSLAAAPGGILLVGAYDDPISPPLLSSFNPNIPDPFDFQTILPGESPAVGITGIAVAPSGTVWAAIYFVPGGGGPGKVLGIDPTTGNVTVLSDDKHGAGPIFVNPYGLTVVPEPGTFVLAAVAGLALLALRRSADGLHHHAGRILLTITLAVSLTGSFVQCASAVQLSTGDIVISADIGPTSGGEDYGLMRVDPVTGDRTIISDATHGSGPTFDFTNHTISSVSRMAGGQLLVSAKNGLFSVDPTTGDRTQINARPTTDAIQVGNQIYAVDRSNLFRVDPTTGNTTNLASGNNTYSLAFANGALYIPIEDSIPIGGSILSYSLSGDYLASYPALFSSGAMTATSDGNLILGSGSGVLNGGAPPVISINPNIPAPFDSHGLPSGPSSLYTVTGLGVSPSGTVWAANIPLAVRPIGNVLGIDPTTGNVTTLSDATHGAGPTLLYPYGLAVVPEPGTFVLAAFGALALLTLRRRKN